MNPNYSILVTGCAGFIGWKVAEFLLKEGYHVVGIDNLNDAYDVRLKHWRLEQLQAHPNFTFHRLDITDYPALRQLFKPHSSRLTPHSSPSPPSQPNEPNKPNRPNKPNQRDEPNQPVFDAVINLAARAGVRQSVEDPWVYYETNVTGTLNLLELCREFGIKKFILASTSSLYGTPHQLNTGEPNKLNEPNEPKELPKLSIPFREDQPTDRPLSPYAASKKAAEALCYTYHHLYQINVIIPRYFTVYGPAGRPDMAIFRFIQWIAEGRPLIVYGDGTQSRDFTYVDDIARGTIAALHYLTTHPSQPTFEIINLGSDRPIQLLEVIHLLEEALGKKARLEFQPGHPADMPATWADITKARQLLGWSPQWDLKKGLEEAVKWYQENRGWAKEILTEK